MIQIQYRRIGPVVIAMTVNDNRDVITAVGLTVEHASGRLCRALA